MKIKFKGNYRGAIHRNSRLEYLAYDKGDEPDLEPEVAAFIAKDAPGIIAGSEKILNTANRMITETETRAEVADQADELEAKTVDELKAIAASMGLKVGGNKQALIVRINNAAQGG